MQVHVTVELFQGVVENVRVFNDAFGAKIAEDNWCRTYRAVDESAREELSGKGTEFIVRVCKVE